MLYTLITIKNIVLHFLHFLYVSDILSVFLNPAETSLSSVLCYSISFLSFINLSTALFYPEFVFYKLPSVSNLSALLALISSLVNGLSSYTYTYESDNSYPLKAFSNLGISGLTIALLTYFSCFD